MASSSPRTKSANTRFTPLITGKSALSYLITSWLFERVFLRKGLGIEGFLRPMWKGYQNVVWLLAAFLVAALFLSQVLGGVSDLRNEEPRAMLKQVKA